MYPSGAKEDSKSVLENLKNELVEIEARLNKLLSAYLDEIVFEEEYLAQKQKMLDQKVELKEKIREIEDGIVSWLEPAREFVKSLNQAQNLLQSENKAEMTTFLKQIGSNHILFDKSFSFLANGPLQIVAERRLCRREAPSSNLQNPDWRATRVKYPSDYRFLRAL